MRTLALVVGVSALALSGCSTLGGIALGGGHLGANIAKDVDAACEISVIVAQVTGDVADVAQQHGIAADEAAKIAEEVAKGGDAVARICTVANIVIPVL